MTILDALEAIAESGIRTGAIALSFDRDEDVDAVYAQLGEPHVADKSDITRPAYEDQDTHGRGYRRVARTTILGLRVVLHGPLRIRRIEKKEAA